MIGVRVGADQEEAACAVEVLVGWVEMRDGVLDPCVHRQPVRLVTLVRGFLLQRLDL